MIFLSCKANARVLLTKTGHGPQLPCMFHSVYGICYSVYRLCDYVLFYVPFMCYSLYCSRIFVNSITATGCQPICSLIIIIIIYKLLRALIMTFLRGVTYLSAHASVKCAHCWHGIGIAICSAKLWV